MLQQQRQKFAPRWPDVYGSLRHPRYDTGAGARRWRRVLIVVAGGWNSGMFIRRQPRAL